MIAPSSFVILQAKELGGEAFLVKADMSKVWSSSNPPRSCRLANQHVCACSRGCSWLGGWAPSEFRNLARRLISTLHLTALPVLRMRPYPCWLQHQEIEAMVKEVSEHWGGLDVLVSLGGMAGVPIKARLTKLHLLGRRQRVGHGWLDAAACSLAAGGKLAVAATHFWPAAPLQLHAHHQGLCGGAAGEQRGHHTRQADDADEARGLAGGLHHSHARSLAQSLTKLHCAGRLALIRVEYGGSGTGQLQRRRCLQLACKLACGSLHKRTPARP